MNNRINNLNIVWVVRECTVCHRTFEVESAGTPDCPQCTELHGVASDWEDMRDKIVADANDAVQERIDYLNEQMDLIKDAIDDDDLDLAREHIAEAVCPSRLRGRERDPRFLTESDYLVPM